MVRYHRSYLDLFDKVKIMDVMDMKKFLEFNSIFESCSDMVLVLVAEISA